MGFIASEVDEALGGCCSCCCCWPLVRVEGAESWGLELATLLAEEVGGAPLAVTALPAVGGGGEEADALRLVLLVERTELFEERLLPDARNLLKRSFMWTAVG